MTDSNATSSYDRTQEAIAELSENLQRLFPVDINNTAPPEEAIAEVQTQIAQYAGTSVVCYNRYIGDIVGLLRNLATIARHYPSFRVLFPRPIVLMRCVVTAIGLELHRLIPAYASQPMHKEGALEGMTLEGIVLAILNETLPVRGSKCPHCNNPKRLIVSSSMRSGDEGMATIYYCVECGRLDKRIRT